MKTLSIVLNVVLGMSILAVSLSGCTPKNAPEASARVSTPAGNNGAARIVYINTDTLMNKYLLAIELNEAFLKKQEERRTELNVKAKSLDEEANEFSVNCRIMVFCRKHVL